MENYTYSGTNASPVCEHDYVELKKGTKISRGKVVKIQTFECSKCLDIRSSVMTQYPPY